MSQLLEIEQKLYFILGWFYDFTKGITVVLLILFLINIFGLTFYLVQGNSMQPKFQDGDLVLVDRFTYHLRLPKKGEVVTIQASIIDPISKIIKRVAALPGEHVSFKAKSDILRWNEYYVLGDNLSHSLDSRHLGPIKISDIDGRVFFKLWHF